MGYSHLVALTGHVEGREQDYNDWYTWVHLRDVMRLSLSVVAAQRFRASDALAAKGGSQYDFPYLCVYEVIDPEAMTADHAPVFTDEMPISDAYDLTRASEVYFDEIASLSRRPGQHGAASVIVERFGQAPCSADLAAWYVSERLPQIAALPGVVGASVGLPNDHQMFEQPLSALCAVYWSDSLADTAAAWPALQESAPDGLDRSHISLNAFEAVIERLTIADVRNPSQADRETAARIRERIMASVHTGPSADLNSEQFA